MTRIEPIIIMIRPLFVHSELLYINEVEGPIAELLCNVNITPAIIIIIPAIIKDVSYFLKFNVFLN
jgi:hypothetical protein